MERPLWDRIQEIYYSTLPMPHSERSAFVATACDHDPFLVREVTSLLSADESSSGFLESSVFELGLKIISSDSANGTRTANDADDLLGTVIDQRYLVERALGHGGMGKVYIARDLTLHNRPVVIKVLLDASVKDTYVVRKFRQEIEALSRIDHPGVVSVLGAGELPDRKPFIVMQYVSGVTLRSQIPSEGMNFERAALILKQIGAALDYVHEKGIFHRDLKPDNIMLQSLKGGTELVKVVDFGIAKVKDSVVAPSTVENVRVGTVLYMSPEQLRGGERITAASDVYSLGVIAYEMVTGRRPFNPASAPQLLEMHYAGVRVKPIDLRTNLSTEAQAIILRALSFERTSRFQSAAEFGDSLARALMNEEETAPRHNPLSNYSGELNDAATFSPGTDVQRPPLPKTQNDHAEPAKKDRMRFRLGKTQLTISIAFLMILAGVLAVLWTIKKQSTSEPQSLANTAETPTPPTRSFVYSLTVQRIRNKKPYEAAFQSTGQDVFDTGDKFHLNVFSSHPGYLYVFNEGSPEPNGSSFSIVYPTPLMNGGSASLGANQKVQTNWNEFTGQPGTENLWIAWAAAAVPELESAKADAFKRQGILIGQSLDAVKAFLVTKEKESKPRIERDKNSQQVTVRGAGDLVVKMLELKHR
ncbi:MAG TPA: serine/threonine-protein kinase [Pyrinomonadaceae bacterium]